MKPRTFLIWLIILAVTSAAVIAQKPKTDVALTTEEQGQAQAAAKLVAQSNEAMQVRLNSILATPSECEKAVALLGDIKTAEARLDAARQAQSALFNRLCAKHGIADLDAYQWADDLKSIRPKAKE